VFRSFGNSIIKDFTGLFVCSGAVAVGLTILVSLAVFLAGPDTNWPEFTLKCLGCCLGGATAFSLLLSLPSPIE